MNESSTRSSQSLFTQVSALFVLLPLLCFAVQGAFSFQRGMQNSSFGSISAGILSSTSDDQSDVLRLQTYMIYGLCVLFALPFTPAIAVFLKRNLALTALIALAAVSALWSNNAKSTLISTAYVGIEVLFAAYLCRRFRLREIMKILLCVGTIAAIASLLMVFAFPEYGVQHRALAEHAWQGIFGQKNQSGAVWSCLVLPALFLRSRSAQFGVFRVVYITGMLLLVWKSESAGAWVICAASVSFALLLHLVSSTKGKDRMLLLSIAGSVVIALLLLVFENYSAFLVLLGKDSTLTGRTVIWAQVMACILKRPLGGYGFMAFWQGLHGESANVALSIGWTGIAYSENGILELALQLGVIGVLLYALMFLRAVRDAIFCASKNASPEILWCCCMLFYVFVSNIEGGKLLAPSDLGTVLPIVVYISLREEVIQLRRSASAAGAAVVSSKEESCCDLPLAHRVGAVL